MTTKASSEGDKPVDEDLWAAAQAFIEVDGRRKEIDLTLTYKLRDARGRGVSWGDLMRDTGLPMGILRQRIGKGPHKPAPTLAEHVGVTEAAKILDLTTSRVGDMARKGEIEFKTVGGKRLYPLAELDKLGDQRKARREARPETPKAVHPLKEVVETPAKEKNSGEADDLHLF